MLFTGWQRLPVFQPTFFLCKILLYCKFNAKLWLFVSFIQISFFKLNTFYQWGLDRKWDFETGLWIAPVGFNVDFLCYGLLQCSTLCSEIPPLFIFGKCMHSLLYIEFFIYYSLFIWFFCYDFYSSFFHASSFFLPNCCCSFQLS